MVTDKKCHVLTDTKCPTGLDRLHATDMSHTTHATDISHTTYIADGPEV